jgi:hypothetical protein
MTSIRWFHSLSNDCGEIQMADVKSTDSKPKSGGVPDIGNVADDADGAITDALAAQKTMMAGQLAVQTAGMKAQLVTAGLNMMGQTVGATTAMAVQTVTDLVKTSKDAVKAQGDAFQKAN